MNTQKKYTAWPLLFLSMLLFLSLQSAYAEDDFVLHLKNAAGVHGERVLLGEIARPAENVSQEKWLHLQGIPLWQAPRRDGRVSLGPNRVKELLHKHLGELAQRIVVRERLVLRKDVSVLDREELRARLKNYLQETTDHWSGEREYRDLRVPDYLFLPKGGRIDFKPARDLQPGRNSLRIHVLDAQKQLQGQANVTATVDLWQEVPCAAKPLNRKQELSDEDISLERKNLAQKSYEIWDGQGGPWRLTRSLGAGRVIYKRNLEPVPLITEGQRVTLVFSGDMVKLQVPAKALQEAGQGETVLVKNLQSDERVYAEVENGQYVLVK